MPPLSLTTLKQTFCIHRFDPDADIPATAISSTFFAITRTEDELSIVLPDTVKLQSPQSDSGWACFKVSGLLDFGQVGILAGLANALADAKISIFAVSTFDTDYVLVKREQAQAAKEALKSAGYMLSN